jgi:hypothetical protein
VDLNSKLRFKFGVSEAQFGEQSRRPRALLTIDSPNPAYYTGPSVYVVSNDTDKGTPGAILGRKAKVFETMNAENDELKNSSQTSRSSFPENVWLPK